MLCLPAWYGRMCPRPARHPTYTDFSYLHRKFAWKLSAKGSNHHGGGHHKASTTENAPRSRALRERNQNQNVHDSQFLPFTPVRLCSVFLTHCRVELSISHITLFMPEPLGHRDLPTPHSTLHHTSGHTKPSTNRPGYQTRICSPTFFKTSKAHFRLALKRTKMQKPR